MLLLKNDDTPAWHILGYARQLPCGGFNHYFKFYDPKSKQFSLNINLSFGLISFNRINLDLVCGCCSIRLECIVAIRFEDWRCSQGKKLHMNICCVRVVTSHSEALSYLEINTLVLEKIVEQMNKETGHVVNLWLFIWSSNKCTANTEFVIMPIFNIREFTSKHQHYAKFDKGIIFAWTNVMLESFSQYLAYVDVHNYQSHRMKLCLKI